MRKIFLSVILLPAALSAQTVSTAPKAEALGIFGADRMNSVLGQDGVTPVPVTFKNGEKRFLWTFGDTILGGWKGPVATTATLNFQEIADMKAMPCNTLALSRVANDENYKNLAFSFYCSSGSPVEFIRYLEGEKPRLKRMWADDGIQAGNRIWIFYMDIKMKDKAGDFDFLGTGLACSAIPAKPGVSELAFTRSEKFYAPGILLGDSVIRKNSWLYLIGRLSRKNDGNLNALFFARVRPARIEDFSAYEFLSAKGKWQKTEKAMFFDDLAGEASLAWDEYGKVFRIIYMSARTQEIKTASFRNFAEFAKKPSTSVIYKPATKKDILYYSAKEIFQDGKTVYLIYIDPSIYQPILVKYEPKYK